MRPTAHYGVATFPVRAVLLRQGANRSCPSRLVIAEPRQFLGHLRPGMPGVGRKSWFLRVGRNTHICMFCSFFARQMQHACVLLRASASTHTGVAFARCSSGNTHTYARCMWPQTHICVRCRAPTGDLSHGCGLTRCPPPLATASGVVPVVAAAKVFCFCVATGSLKNPFGLHKFSPRKPMVVLQSRRCWCRCCGVCCCCCWFRFFCLREVAGGCRETRIRRHPRGSVLFTFWCGAPFLA